mmetsp:Transcript_99213/g.286249  ORF Transcript_99213/g.286249 Transcript_99213/m.286249 type:complete len:374 (-) Transcript_99213:31-1152(-)
MVGRELLADRGDDDVRRLEVGQVEVVHQGDEREHGAPESELRLVPTRLAGPPRRQILRAIVGGWAQPGVHDLFHPPVLVEVRVSAVPREALANREPGEDVRPHDEVPGAALGGGLDAVGAQAVEAEARERLVTPLVLPVLVDDREDVADLTHDIVDGVLVVPESLEIIGHRQLRKVPLDGVKQRVLAVGKVLILVPPGHPAVESKKQVVLIQLCLWPDLVCRHAQRIDGGCFPADEPHLVCQVQQFRVRIALPVPWPEVPHALVSEEGAERAAEQDRQDDRQNGQNRDPGQPEEVPQHAEDGYDQEVPGAATAAAAAEEPTPEAGQARLLLLPVRPLPLARSRQQRLLLISTLKLSHGPGTHYFSGRVRLVPG